MNKCLSLVHLTSTIGPESSGSGESNSRFLRCPKLDLDSAGTKSVSGRLTLIAAAPCSALRLNFRAGNHSNEVFRDTSTVVVLENLPESPRGNPVKIGLPDFHAWR